jgi:hypothetical protein
MDALPEPFPAPALIITGAAGQQRQDRIVAFCPTVGQGLCALLAIKIYKPFALHGSHKEKGLPRLLFLLAIIYHIGLRHRLVVNHQGGVWLVGENGVFWQVCE